MHYNFTIQRIFPLLPNNRFVWCSFIQLLWARNGHCFTNCNITWPTISYMWPCDVHCQYCSWSLVTISRWLPLDPDQASGRDVRSCYDWQWTTLPIDQFLFVCMFVSSASHVMNRTKRNCSIVMINYSGGDDNQGTYLLAVTWVMMTSQPWRPMDTIDTIWLNIGCVKIKVAHYTSLTLSKTTYFYGILTIYHTLLNQI